MQRYIRILGIVKLFCKKNYDMKKYTDVNATQFSDLQKVAEGEPFQMLNLLKFKKDGGAEKYKEYMRAAAPFFARANAEVLYYGNAELTLIGPSETREWDKILLVEYASKEDFLAMITDVNYPTHLRKAALEDSRLLLCRNGK